MFKKKTNSSTFCILCYCFQLSCVKPSACPNYRIQVTRPGNILHFSTYTYTYLQKNVRDPTSAVPNAVYKIIQDSTIKLYYPVSVIVSILKSGTQPCRGHLVLIQKCPVRAIMITPDYRIFINNINGRVPDRSSVDSKSVIERSVIINHPDHTLIYIPKTMFLLLRLTKCS